MHGPVSSQVPKSSSFKRFRKTTRKTRWIRIELFLSFFSLFVSWVSLRIRYPWHAGFCAQMAPLFFKYIFGRPINWAHNQCAVELDSNYFPFRFYFPVPCLYTCTYHTTLMFSVAPLVSKLSSKKKKSYLFCFIFFEKSCNNLSTDGRNRRNVNVREGKIKKNSRALHVQAGGGFVWGWWWYL